jgi:replicative DNA helicase
MMPRLETRPANDELPPMNLDAERHVLGRLLLDPGEVTLIDPPLAVADFWSVKNGALYTILVDLGEATNAVTVCSENTQRNAGWSPAEVTMLMADAAGEAPRIAACAEIVRAMARRRRLIDVAKKLTAGAYAIDAESMALADAARHDLDAVTMQEVDNAVLTFPDSLFAYPAILGDRRDAVERKPLTFPWPSLARKVSRLRPGEVCAVGAQSGVGKTMFCECLAEHWARQGFNTAYFHFELSRQTMLDRRMARLSGVPIEDLERGVCDDRVADTLQEMTRWQGKITYVHCPGWTIGRVVTKARLLAATAGLDVLIVDYLQKVRFSEVVRGLTPAQMRGQDVEALKVLSEELGIVAVVATQLNREAAGQTRKTRHTIRDTGELDEKANVVILLDRDLLSEPLRGTAGEVVAEAGEYSPLVTVRVDKVTLGRPGELHLMADGPRFDFIDT